MTLGTFLKIHQQFTFQLVLTFSIRMELSGKVITLFKMNFKENVCLDMPRRRPFQACKIPSVT
uniref:Uncharacterized protein n=1 Tax=Anguilla anguilla TaxID=7936 RepID=A0A0E9RA84_ANGAN